MILSVINNKSICGLAFSALFSAMLHIIRVVKISCGLNKKFHHCDDTLIVDKSTDDTKPHLIC